MTTWKIAGAQMDCRFGDKPGNLEIIRANLREAAGRGARLVVFPERDAFPAPFLRARDGSRDARRDPDARAAVRDGRRRDGHPDAAGRRGCRRSRCSSSGGRRFREGEPAGPGTSADDTWVDGDANPKTAPTTG